jgi:hypothetical protein
MEARMILPGMFRPLVFVFLMFVSAAAYSQSPGDDLAPLPLSPSPEQLLSLSYLTPAPHPLPLQTQERRRLPRRIIPLTTEELAYRDAVRSLGIDPHRFVHFELAGGKVRTGAIIHIGDDGFTLRDGILMSTLIRYSQLTAPPRPAPAVGTHMVNALKWTGLVAGCVAAAPLVLVFYPLVLAGVIKD